MHPLEQLRDDALREIEAAADEQALEAARVKYLGKSGSISAWGEQMKALAKEEKPVVGKVAQRGSRPPSPPRSKRAPHNSARKKNRARSPRSTSRCRERRTKSARCIRSRRCGNVRSKFFGEWGSRSRTDRTLKTNGIVSTRSTRRPNIRRETSRTHFICRTAVCCERTLRPCKFERCKPRRRRFV